MKTQTHNYKRSAETLGTFARPSLTVFAVVAVSAALCTGLLGACGTPQTSGESHFGSTRAYLRVCEDGVCEEGDSCECAVCTVSCAEPADCAARILGPSADPEDLPDNVVCRVPLCIEESEGEVSGGSDAVCEVVCTADEECAFLDRSHDGRPHVCRSGACRTDEDPENPSEPEVPQVVCPEGRALIPGAVAPDGIALCLDVTEVTVAAFGPCVGAGDCDAPTTGNYLTAGREGHPINFVSPEQAAAYCAFSGARLVTHDEWLSAAGDSTFPWGESVPTGTEDPPLVCAISEPTTCETGSYLAGAGPHGHLDLFGNVAELVVAADAGCFVGGAFDTPADALEGATCEPFVAATEAIGFRCVSDL